MNHKKTIIALAVIMMAVVPMSLAMSDLSDAGMSLDDENIRAQGFTDMGDGTLFVTLKNTEVISHAVTITVTENGKLLAKTTETVPAGESSFTVELKFSLNTLGSHTVTITCEPASLFPEIGGAPLNYNTFTIDVTRSIWSSPTTYVAIIVVVALIAIGIFLQMRNAPVKKPEMTFTELEKQQKESKADTGEASRSSATERRRYRAENPPKEEKKKEEKKASPPPQPPAEKKAASFTELQKQKDEKKASEPKKEPSSDEPKKLKYISSRRK